ncbi:MAG: hypothetical protein QCI00_09100, partial [Candidatus Thermoplasmatota archaeon]|nr:hypothetical protein [Candidatus Thermoplasmatota archaeon]
KATMILSYETITSGVKHMFKISHQTTLGIIIVVFGLLVLLRTTAIYDTGQLLLYTPSLFVLLGVYSLLKTRFSNLVGPIILIIVFGTIQLLVLGKTSFDTVRTWWPILLILIGIGIILSKKITSSVSRSATGEEKVDMLAIFSDIDSYAGSDDFTGGDITTIFGEAELDMRDVSVTYPVKLNILSLFGDIDIIVPEKSQVRIDVVPFIADIIDKRSRSQTPMKSNDQIPEIVIKGFIAFSDLSIKH